MNYTNFNAIICDIVCEALVLAVGLLGLKYQLGGMFTYDG